MRSSSTKPSSATMAAASIFLVVQSTIMLASAQQQSGQQPILCVDNHRYISRFGLNCEMHRKLHCDSFAHIGFSPMEVLELYTACPIACQREECLAEYRAIYDDAANGSTFSCEDDQDYTSPFGMKCVDHASIDCEQLIALGMQPHQMEELLDACPRSCDVPRPECSLYAPIDQAGSNQANSASNVGENAVFESNNDDLGGACFEGWDETCQDNSEYTSPMGLGCAESFGKIDCLKLSRVGFTEIQMLEAIQNCPCSCKVECGYSMPPSSSPTSSPSDVPSMEPSASPTMPPTARPSASPSDVPSFGPTASPSTMPSASPTKAPTSRPSAVPSASPTQSPTQSPTSSPSHSPSSSPTHRPSSSPSSAPTSSPSARPTVSSMPSSKPTPIASSAPSDVPSGSPSFQPSLSSEPSSQPTVTASQYPSTQPSSSPSSSPSAHPTQSPTLSPSERPSFSPSSAPTDVCSTYGWENQCSDDPNFRSFLGFGCSHHAALICTDLHHIGFSAKEIDALIEACPCSCQIECGTWGGTPTARPTTYSHALRVGAIQTSAPTPKPTTAAPSTAPTTNMPTSNPSKAPNTAAPTEAPVSPASTSLSPTPLPPTNQPVSSSPTPKPVSILSLSPTQDKSASLRGGTDNEPKKEPFVFASANQEDQNAIYEITSKDSSFLAIICIGVFAVIGSVGALLYLRKRRDEEPEDDEWNTNLEAVLDDEDVEITSPDGKGLEMEFSRSSSHDSSSYQMNSYQNNIAFVPVRNPPNEMLETEAAMNFDADLVQRDEAVTASSLDETEEGCKPACFGWSLESFLGLKPSNAPAVAEPRSAEPDIGGSQHAVYMAAMEEDSVSNAASPRTHENEADDTYFTETLRDKHVAAARADPSSIELIVPSIFEEVSADDDSTNILIDEHNGFLPAGQLPSGGLEPLETEGNMSTIAEEPHNAAAHSDAEDDASEFDEESIDDGEASNEAPVEEEQKANNSQNHIPLPRIPIDGALSKKFARRGLRTISSRGKK